jgi:PAS domain-containing protein
VEAETSARLAAGDAFSHSFRIVRADGAIRTVLDHGRIIRDASGAARALLGVNVDVTDLEPASADILAQASETVRKDQATIG